MREITGFAINPANEKLKIEVTDEPGAGGANHRYIISGFDLATNPSGKGIDGSYGLPVIFQNGTIPENGVNGVTQEALLAIVIDRLRSFQAGKFACRENALAVTKLEEAMHWLQHRTRSRIDRGVEGAHKA
jgi:hypothetical protein